MSVGRARGTLGLLAGEDDWLIRRLADLPKRPNEPTTLRGLLEAPLIGASPEDNAWVPEWYENGVWELADFFPLQRKQRKTKNYSYIDDDDNDDVIRLDLVADTKTPFDQAKLSRSLNCAASEDAANGSRGGKLTRKMTGSWHLWIPFHVNFLTS